MYWYALVGLLATTVLIIENFDILFSRGDNQKFHEIKIYRRFLFGIMAYYITDILWGLLDSLQLFSLLYLDTLVYYVAMAVGVLLWTQFVVTYLGEDNAFSRFLSNAGRFCFAAVMTITIVNIFTPVLFWFDENGTYHACPARHIQLLFQIILLMLTSVYTFRVILHSEGTIKKRYQTICMFGLVVASLLLLQLPYPFLPLYTIGYMLGSSLLHAFVVSNEVDELLQRQSELAIAANEAKSSFLSNMSHEIRTPINTILGMNEMIMRECDKSDTDILMYSKNVITAGNTLLGIVNDILDFSKIEEGKLEIIPEDYELSSLMNDLINMIKTKLDDKRLHLNLEIDKNIPERLHGDEIRIKQIITNILTNAAKYTEKGSVTFSVSYEKIEDDPNALMLKVAVKDTGIGIRPEDMDKLFIRFERFEEERNRGIEGTGLGLSITENLLKMMDSSLNVESIYGEGSRFSFSIRQEVVDWQPIGDYEETWKRSAKSVVGYREKIEAPEAQILVVDDNSLNLMVFAGLLKQTGIKIDKAESGDEGIEYALKKHYDIIFLDHMMPEKNGIETLHELKADPQGINRDTPYICLTANAISGAREKYIEAGFTDYLTKPINTEELENMLLKYLPEDKVRLTTDDGEPDQLTQSEDEIPEAFKELQDKGIDVKTGIVNTGSVRSYISVLELFYETIEDKSSEIERYYRNEDIENYVIKVHALKSSAKTIGATELGYEAQLLEEAGKRKDIEYIEAHNDAFIEKYRGFKEPLSYALKKYNKGEKGDEAGRIADRAVMAGAYEKLKDAAEDMDCEKLDQIFKDMEGYIIPEDEGKLFSELQEAAKEFNYKTILSLLENVH